MSYAVAVGQRGIGGWRLLSRTADQQKAIIAREPGLAKAHDHTRVSLKQATTAEAFVSDYRLLKTTLEAFGLEADIRNRAFIRKVVESDLSDPKSLANRLSDKRYLAMAKTLAMGPNAEPNGTERAETIVSRHIAATFENRVGQQDNDLRLALNARRELTELAASPSNDATKWYTIIGSRQLRAVVGGALGLPAGFEKLNVDRQLDDFRAIAQRKLGSSKVADLAQPKALDKMIERFLARAQISSNVMSRASAALTLLANR